MLLVKSFCHRIFMGQIRDFKPEEIVNICPIGLQISTIYSKNTVCLKTNKKIYKDV